MRTLNKYLITILLSCTLLPVMAQKGWYVGFQGGPTLVESTFSSLGEAHSRPGFIFGIGGGYRFCHLLSIEATAKWGEAALYAQDCCHKQNYWLGADGIRYYSPVLDAKGWHYTDLKSSLFQQHYGIQLNVNLLGFFHDTRHSHWRLELAPVVAAVGTRARLKSISQQAAVKDGNSHWHLGVGGHLQASYQLTELLQLGIYTGFTHLTGSPIDAIPSLEHNTNYVWEGGIKLSFTLKRCAKTTDKIRK